MRRGFGWLPDLPKRADAHPDWAFRDTRTAARRTVVPTRHSNADLVVDILDQAGLGACVPCAGFQAVRMAHARQGVRSPRLGARLFAYYLARTAHGVAAFDAGTQLRTFFWAINNYGYLFEDEASNGYDIFKFREPPTAADYRLAFDNKHPTHFWAIPPGADRIDTIKRAVSLGLGVTFGVMVDDDFADGRFDAGRPLVPPVGRSLNGHAMLIDGYDGDAFSVVNSWGTDWGNAGRCLLAAEYLEDAHSIWVVEAAPKGSPKGGVR